jgi:hypothetical protein
MGGSLTDCTTVFEKIPQDDFIQLELTVIDRWECWQLVPHPVVILKLSTKFM